MAQLTPRQIATIGVAARLVKQHRNLLTAPEADLVAEVVGRWAAHGDEAQLDDGEWLDFSAAVQLMRGAAADQARA